MKSDCKAKIFILIDLRDFFFQNVGAEGENRKRIKIPKMDQLFAK